MIYLDTHAIIYLYAGDLNLFSKRGQELIKQESLIISPIVILELQYLFEIGKLKIEPSSLLSTLKTNVGLQICNYSFTSIITTALSLTWTRDPFDRMIVANAMTKESALLTKDQSILEHYELATW